jgi:hypothetical protein
MAFSAALQVHPPGLETNSRLHQTPGGSVCCRRHLGRCPSHTLEFLNQTRWSHAAAKTGGARSHFAGKRQIRREESRISNCDPGGGPGRCVETQSSALRARACGDCWRPELGDWVTSRGSPTLSLVTRPLLYRSPRGSLSSDEPSFIHVMTLVAEVLNPIVFGSRRLHEG